MAQAESEDISVDGEYVQINDDKNSGEETFTHSIGNILTGQAGGTLTVYYNGEQASAKSIIDIGEITGSGDLVLEGMSVNTLKLFRLAEGATNNFGGNLTICNYNNTWEGAETYDTAAVLELEKQNLAGSISLDVAGYCDEDSFFIAAVGLNGDVSVGGLDAPKYIAPASYLYSGHIKESTTHLFHKSGLRSYIDAMQHTLTIDTAGTHHFYGKVISAVSIVKKGSGTQSFTGTFAAGSSFQVLGGGLHLAADIEASTIDIQNAALNHTGMLHTATLNMHNGALSVSGTLTADSARFSGANTLTAGQAEGTNWIIDLSSTHKEQAAITLESATGVSIDYLNIRYDKEQLLRGWYHVASNSSGLSAGLIQANGSTACTETRNNALWLYVADGELTQPRTEATLTWQASSGTWETGKGHADMSWSGPESNSNFLAGDHVCFSNASTVNLAGDLQPGSICVSHSSGAVTFEGRGSLSGAASLSKTGGGELCIATANSFTGGTTVSAGTLRTLHANALGSGDISLQGGILDLSGQGVANALHVHGDSEVCGAQQYEGQLVVHSGILRGANIQLRQTAQLHGGEIAAGLTGNAAVRVTGAGTLSGDNAHTGGILLDNGRLTLATPGALGTGNLTATGNSSLTAEGFTLVLQKPIENSGNLTLHGHFDATALAESTAATMVDAYGNEGGQSGFLRDAGCKAQLTTGGSLNTANATILLHEKRVTADAGGKISLPGMLHTDVYKITGEHSVSSSAIMEAAGESVPVIHMDSGTLQINTSTDTLQACGGLVQIETARLGGSLSGDTQVEILGDAIMTGNNTHTGGTTLAAGSLKIEHAHALGTGAVHLGSRARAAAPLLDLGNLQVNNHLHLYGSSELCGLENFSGSITMSSGAETTIRRGEVFNLRPGQTLTLAPGGNTIHGHVNLDGGTIILTGGLLTLDGVVNFSKPTTIDLSQWATLDDEMVIFNFPGLYDEEMVRLILPAHLANEQISLDPQTGALQIAPVTQPQNLTHALNRNQRAAYEALRRINPATVSGELAALAETAATCADADKLRQLMDRAGGAGYTALINSMADDALAHLHRLRRSAGTPQQISPQHQTAVGISAYNHTGSMDSSPGYERTAWGGQLMLEHRPTPKLTLGLSLENGSTRITPDADDTHSDTATHAAVYALYTDSEWHFLLAAGFGMHEFSLSRMQADGRSAKVENTGGNTINIAAEITRSFELTRHSQLCPYLALQSTCATRDAFHESGSSASLHAEEEKISLTELNLGLLYETTLADSLLLNLHGELIATFGDTKSEIEMYFEDAPEENFTQYGPERGSLGYRVGISLALPLTPDCSLHAAASARIQCHEQNINSRLGILLHF